MKKKILLTTLVVFIGVCIYNVCLVSNSKQELINLTLGNIEAIASDETGNECKESVSSGRKETLSDGAFRFFIKYTCGYLPGGPCKSGTVVEYYNASGSYIGADDQRSNLYCF